MMPTRPARKPGTALKQKRVATPRKRKRATKKVVEPAVIPMLSYEDGVAALAWLRKAFGFREITRHTTPDGRLSHGEMQAGDGLIMLASPTPDYQSPKRHREVCELARKWSTVPWVIDGVLVYVNNLNRHFARAKAAGATILSDIEPGPPGRRYRAEDFEGHRWFFFETK
jgi:uncharacterized glyoxalase superfamily protein PhnB